MKKLITITFIALGVMGCERKISDEEYLIPSMTNASGTTSVYVVTIDSCEYIKGYRSLSHKGNCSNPIHNK